MKILERKRATELRKQGKTFNEIIEEIPVSKSSLSYWLRDVQLTPQQLIRIQYKNEEIKRKFIIFNELRKKRAAENKARIINEAGKEIDGITRTELKSIGIALYWAEGYKTDASSGVEFTNSDSAMIRLMMRWFREICHVQESRFRIRIQMHNAEDIEKVKRHWSKITGIKESQFTKVYVKTSSTSKRIVGNLLPCGICNIRISDINLITRIKGWINRLMALSSSPA